MSEYPAPASLRPLPSRPNIEFERKRAKQLVRSRAGTIALAEAQRIIAREYGFSSWQKLLVYYTTAHAHEQLAVQQWSPGGGFDRSVEVILQECRDRRGLVDQPDDVNGTAAAAASYVPRLFGLTNAEIFASDISEAEARLIVARRWRFPSWDALTTQRTASLAFAAAFRRDGEDTNVARSLQTRPNLQRAPSADTPYDELTWKRILQELIADKELALAYRHGTSIDLQPHLDYALLGIPGWGVSTSYVRGLLDLGANPASWARNGATVLEHALALYKNGEAASLIAARVRPPRAIWIAAGLGDTANLRRYFDRRGRLTDAARNHRLDMVALGSIQFQTGRPNASDTEILSEAFLIAGLNSRTASMQVLLDVGFPIDYVYQRYTMLHIAVEAASVPVVEFLLQNGADPNFTATPDSPSPSEFAHVAHASDEHADARQKIRHLIAPA